MSNAVVVTASVTPRPGQRAAVLSHLKTAVPQVILHDPGCELYAVHENEVGFVMVEKWADEAAFDAHIQGPFFATLVAQLHDLLEQPVDVRVSVPVTVEGLLEEAV